MVGFNPNMQCLMMKSNHGNLAGDTKQQFDVSLLAVKYLQSTQQLCNNKSLLQYYSHLSLLHAKFYSKIIDRQIVLSLFTHLTCKHMASEAVNYDAGSWSHQFILAIIYQLLMMLNILNIHSWIYKSGWMGSFLFEDAIDNFILNYTSGSAAQKKIQEKLKNDIKQLHEEQKKIEKAIMKQRKVKKIKTCFKKINKKVKEFAIIHVPCFGVITL